MGCQRGDGRRCRICPTRCHFLAKFDGVLLPGGFSYGDYLRCGAIARFSPIINEVIRFATEGKMVLVLVMAFKF